MGSYVAGKSDMCGNDLVFGNEFRGIFGKCLWLRGNWYADFFMLNYIPSIELLKCKLKYNFVSILYPIINKSKIKPEKTKKIYLAE